MKRSELKRKTPLKRTAIKRKPNKNAIPRSSSDAVMKRSGGMCEVCGLRPYQGTHHREGRRSRNHDPDNLLAVCEGVGGCHSKIHADQEWARENGYIVRQSKVDWMRKLRGE